MEIRDIALFIILAGSIPIILWRPWIGILLWYWVGLMNPHRLTWGFMYDFHVAMLVAATTLVALLLARDRQPPPLTRETILLGLFAIWMTITTFQAWVPSMAWSYWPQPLKIMLFAIVTPMLIHGRKRTEWLIIVITGSLAFYGVKGGIFALLTGGEARVLGPPASFIEGNTALGLAMLMVMPLILVLARHARAGTITCPPLSRWRGTAGLAGYASFWLTALATVITYSRGALVGMAAIAPFLFLKMRYKPVLLLLAFVTFSSLAVLFPERLIERAETIQNYQQDHSAMQRIQAWGVSWNIAVEHPLGAGFHFEDAGDERWLSYANFIGEWRNVARVAHSNYFQVLGQHGFVGLALYLGLLISTLATLFRLGWKARGRSETGWISDYAWALFVGTIGYAAAGAFLNLAYFTLFYAFIAATMVLRREYARTLEQVEDSRDAGSVAKATGTFAGGSAR